MSDVLAIAIIGAVVTIINSFLIAWVKVTLTKYHNQVNGRVGELLETTKKLGNAEGKATEKAKNKKV